MSQYDRELHQFIMGEYDPTGWKSDWRREQERRRAEEMGKRTFVTAPQIKARQERKPRFRKSRHVAPVRFCGECGKGLASWNKIGFCVKHATSRRRTTFEKGEAPTCKVCSTPISRYCKYGLCRQHAGCTRQLAHLARKKERRELGRAA